MLGQGGMTRPQGQPAEAISRPTCTWALNCMHVPYNHMRLAFPFGQHAFDIVVHDIAFMYNDSSAARGLLQDQVEYRTRAGDATGVVSKRPNVSATDPRSKYSASLNIPITGMPQSGAEWRRLDVEAVSDEELGPPEAKRSARSCARIAITRASSLSTRKRGQSVRTNIVSRIKERESSSTQLGI